MRYIAFFRGINVGGKNIVKMADLKQMFIELGFGEVKTYIQSGNVVFSSVEDEKSLISAVSEAFEKRFAFRSAIIIRSAEEIEQIINFKPFDDAEIDYARNQDAEVEHEYIYLSDETIDKCRVMQLCEGFTGEDKIYIAEREIYLLCCQSVRDSKLAIRLAKYSTPMTARNLKAMKKIAEIL